MRQIFGEIRWEIKAAIFLGLVVSFALFGPFGTYTNMTFAERLSFWTGVMFFVGFFIHVSVHVALTLPALSGLRPILRVWIAVAIGAIPSAAMVAVLYQSFRGSEITAESLFSFWWQIGLIAGVIAPLEYLDLRSNGAIPATPAPSRTRFHDRLSPALGDQIISLSMQDHYVEVTTTSGSELILIRMRDAVNELDGLAGLQLHRSHWAVATHLRGLEKEGGRQFVLLSDGRRLPVSATHLDAVQSVLASAA